MEVQVDAINFRGGGLFSWRGVLQNPSQVAQGAPRRCRTGSGFLFLLVDRKGAMKMTSLVKPESATAVLLAAVGSTGVTPLAILTTASQAVPSVLLTASQCAQYLGIDRSSFWRWLRDGAAPAPTMRRGRIVRWHRDVIEQFAREGVTA